MTNEPAPNSTIAIEKMFIEIIVSLKRREEVHWAETPDQPCH